MAKEIGHPYSLANSYWGQALIHHFRGEHHETLAQANNLYTFSHEHDFSALATGAEWFKEASLVGLGQILEGMAQMRELLETNLSQIGYGAWRINFCDYLDACLLSGSLDEGLQVIDRASNYLKQPGQRLFDSEIQRLHGELILAKEANWTAEAERLFQLAIDIAQRQSAKSLELRVVMSLARLWQRIGEREKAHQLLEDCYGWFSEGFDTADLVAAKDLLHELA